MLRTKENISLNEWQQWRHSWIKELAIYHENFYEGFMLSAVYKTLLHEKYWRLKWWGVWTLNNVHKNTLAELIKHTIYYDTCDTHVVCRQIALLVYWNANLSVLDISASMFWLVTWSASFKICGTTKNCKGPCIAQKIWLPREITPPTRTCKFHLRTFPKQEHTAKPCHF